MATLYLDSGGASTNSGSSDSASPDLTGTSNATTAAAKTFADANVTVATDNININAHGFISGSGVQLTTTGTLPAGLALLTLYFIFAVDANNITLHNTMADGIAGTNPVDITAAAGGGTHTVNNYTIVLGGSPDLSALLADACVVTTTGTSHVFTMQGGPHGLSTGDYVGFDVSQPVTVTLIPGGITRNLRYFVNVLTSTTFRVYSTAALAITGGASDVNVTTATGQLLRIISAQQIPAINLASATNTGRKIFWIRAYDNTIDAVVVDAVVTGLGAGSSWAIGGQVNAAGATWVAGALRHGDTGLLNTDLSASGLNLEFRNGASNLLCKLIGKPGARRALVNTSGSATIIHSNNTGNLSMQNIEFIHQGTGQAWDTNAGGVFFGADCRFTDSGATQVVAGGNAIRTMDCEFSGCGPVGVGIMPIHVRGWFHDLLGAVSASGNNNFINCIMDRAATTGHSISAFAHGFFYGCTVYRLGGNAIQFLAPGTINAAGGSMALVGNILLDNGNVATEANVVQTTIDEVFFVYDRGNVVSNAGSLGGSNTLGFTLDASDITSDPDLVDPDNASAANRNYGLNRGSPAKSLQYQFTGNTGTISYVDAGAVQSVSDDVNITHVNGIAVSGSGTEVDPWGPNGASTPPVDVNITHVNGIAVTGSGTEGDPWGPA